LIACGVTAIPCAANADVNACGTCPASRTVVPAMSQITNSIFSFKRHALKNLKQLDTEAP
jgi:sulfur relay (sulfurtransferase) complex TusBCD TusD component (DsrE family)